ncbi:death-associated inhibitor of apoptosis 1-like [Ruditapes philippinarum]|uniref:death-associated inhibitor of apoptosis 1-like n=1 Tax=Ruditapes philippinarum TaxID=129788 RepID=UPI00295B35C7|nr:death-associated inhibitor of apoptosis 1-like [Ruditapes philippinarum]
MVHEWARLESFQTFPKKCPVSTLRLAQTGFYSTGKGVEVICFCCGLKNEHWTENETVSELHKRLSPHCKFLRGEDSDNVPIHGVNVVNRNDTEGACGGPNDDPKNRRNPHQEHNEKSGKQTNDRMRCNKETEQHLDKITHQLNQHYSVPENGNVHRMSDNDITAEIQYFPGIPNDQPKRPEYAIRSERLLSFSAWSLNNIMKPEALAEAGFFFHW